MTDKEKEKQKRWRLANPEKYKAQRDRANQRRKERGYYEKNADTIFENYLKRTYKIDLNKYNSLLSEQSGVCAVCKNECVTGKKLAVDHNHDTGEVRGLLCAKCNRGIGNFNDNLDRLKSAVLYLEKHSEL